MSKTKLKRQGLLGQFVLGRDGIGAPVQTTVDPSAAYTRTHRPGGLVIGGRSPRNFYHPNSGQGVIYRAVNLIVYRLVDFSGFSLNANASLANGLTVDGLINPAMPSGGGLMIFTRSAMAWQDLGLPNGITPRTLRVTSQSNMQVELPQFIGYREGLGDQGGYIDTLRVNIIGPFGSNLVGIGDAGISTHFYPYRTMNQIGIANYDFSLSHAPTTFDFEVWVNWHFPNGRYNLQSLEFRMTW